MFIKSRIYVTQIFEDNFFEKSNKTIAADFYKKYKVYKNLLLFSLEYFEYFKKAEEYLKKIKIEKKKDRKFRKWIYKSFMNNNIHDSLLTNDAYSSVIKLCVNNHYNYQLEDKAKNALMYGSVENYKVIREELFLRGISENLDVKDVLFSNNIDFLRKKLGKQVCYGDWDVNDMLKFSLENLLDNSCTYLISIICSGNINSSCNHSLLLLLLYEKCDDTSFRILCEKCTNLTLGLEICIILEKFEKANYILKNYFEKIEMRYLIENKKEKVINYILK